MRTYIEAIELISKVMKVKIVQKVFKKEGLKGSCHAKRKLGREKIGKRMKMSSDFHYQPRKLNTRFLSEDRILLFDPQ